MRRLTVLVLLLTLTGCGSRAYQGALITATNADKRFVETAALYNHLCPIGKLTPTQCEAWRAFMPRYQTVSDQAYQALKQGQDVANTEELIGLVTQLATELTLYYALGDKAGR